MYVYVQMECVSVGACVQVHITTPVNLRAKGFFSEQCVADYKNVHSLDKQSGLCCCPLKTYWRIPVVPGLASSNVKLSMYSSASITPLL